jgi:hypothetical protein
VIDRSNYLFTQIKNLYTATQLKDASQTYQSSPPVFPSMFFNQIGNDGTADDLDNTENAVNTTVEITFYDNSTTKLTTCKNLMATADTKMRSMGFRRVFGPQQITNIADTTICRYIARYNRVIGSGDTL